MSLSWREQICVALSPQQLVLLQLGRGGRRAMIGQVVTCPPAAPDESPWASSLRVLQTTLSKLAKGRAEVTLVLSNHFVRYQLLPWSDRLGSEAEEQAYARFGFVQVYGAVAESWVIRLAEQAGDEPWLASAVDAEFVAGLEATITGAGLRLRSIQPWLMAAFNRWRRQMRGDSIWLVLAEPGRLLLALVRQGCWSNLASVPIRADWTAELPALIERQQLLAGLGGQAARVYVCATTPEVPGEADPDGPMHWLRPEPIRGQPVDQAMRLQLAWF